jgi:hypothetical protein
MALKASREKVGPHVGSDNLVPGQWRARYGDGPDGHHHAEAQQHRVQDDYSLPDDRFTRGHRPGRLVASWQHLEPAAHRQRDLPGPDSDALGRSAHLLCRVADHPGLSGLRFGSGSLGVQLVHASARLRHVRYGEDPEDHGWSSGFRPSSLISSIDAYLC